MVNSTIVHDIDTYFVKRLTSIFCINSDLLLNLHCVGVTLLFGIKDYIRPYFMIPKILFPLLGFATALIICIYAIPVIIKVAFIRKIYDKPGGRKTHKGYIPNLGGVAIFAGFVISFICWTQFSDSVYLQYLILGLILLHFLGVKDDIVPLAPHKKLLGQILAALVLVVPGKFRINDLHGILSIYQLSVPVSIGLSIFVVVFLINSFNLIDGIDGLAGGISLLITLAFSYIFWKSGQYNITIATLALAGALVGFLYYNRQPARIFMGDAGSMCIGYLMAAFGFLFLSVNSTQTKLFDHNPAVLLCFFVVPVFDTLRVFSIRIAHKTSPFKADSNHIHHKLLALGLSHGKTAILLTTVNAIFIVLGYILRDLNSNIFLAVILSLAFLLSAAAEFVKIKRRTVPSFPIQTDYKPELVAFNPPTLMYQKNKNSIENIENELVKIED